MPLQGFRVVAGPSVSTQFQWINGQSSSSRTYSYVLLPTQQGTSPWTYKISHRQRPMYRPMPSALKWLPALPHPLPRRGGVPPPGPLDIRRAGRRTGRVADEVLCRRGDGPSPCLSRPAINLDLKVYTQAVISGLELKESPALEGGASGWRTSRVPRNPTPDDRGGRGRQYLGLFFRGQTAGAVAKPGQSWKIPASTLHWESRVRSNDPFSFFNYGDHRTGLSPNPTGGGGHHPVPGIRQARRFQKPRRTVLALG